MTITALHGFLGRPRDFDGLGLSLMAVDYFRIRELSPVHDLKTWAVNFNQFVQTEERTENKRILIGYSLGGRLALHAVQQNPKLWAGLILISVNPGIPLWEKAARLASDEKWAHKFETGNFENVLEKWNAQQVFQGGGAEPTRKESDHNRHLLAQCLTQWSVGRQDDFREFLKTTKMPVAYISGDRDLKYAGIGESLHRANPAVQIVSVANSGHRVLFDQPPALAAVIRDFISKV